MNTEPNMKPAIDAAIDLIIKEIPSDFSPISGVSLESFKTMLGDIKSTSEDYLARVQFGDCMNTHVGTTGKVFEDIHAKVMKMLKESFDEDGNFVASKQ